MFVHPYVLAVERRRDRKERFPQYAEGLSMVVSFSLGGVGCVA